MIKIIISDLDETLLGHDRTVPEANIEAIKKAQEQGIKFIPATGRPFHSIKKTLDQLNLNGDDDLSISYNGGMIHRNSTQEVLSSTTLPLDIAEWLYKFGLQFDVCIHVFVENATYAYGYNEDERLFCAQISHIEEIFDESLDFIGEEPILKLIYQNLDKTYLESIEAQIPNEIKEHLEISYSSNRYLELNPKGVSKGNALKYVSELLDVPLNQMLAIGDNHNDLSMLIEAGFSAAPSNAVDAIHLDADYISPYRFDEDAVADIIEHFIKL